MYFPVVAAVCEEYRRSPLYKKNPRPAHVAACSAYASEMLPAILGGEWLVPKRGVDHWPDVLLKSKPWRREVSVGGIFDHTTVFRRRGTRGRATKKHLAVITQPYNLFDSWSNARRSAIEGARCLRTLGVGVWVRPDLSSWNPGNTSLVVVAAGLLDLDPAAFGFQSLADG